MTLCRSHRVGSSQNASQKRISPVNHNVACFITLLLSWLSCVKQYDHNSLTKFTILFNSCRTITKRFIVSFTCLANSAWTFGSQSGKFTEFANFMMSTVTNYWSNEIRLITSNQKHMWCGHTSSIFLTCYTTALIGLKKCNGHRQVFVSLFLFSFRIMIEESAKEAQI